MSPNAVYKLRGEVENIVKNHNCIKKHERKRNPNGIKTHKDSKAPTQNVMYKDFITHKRSINK